MSFTYGPFNNPPTLNPPIDFPRTMVGDVNVLAPIFQDEQILAIEQITVATAFQSGMFWSTPNGAVGGGTLGTFAPQLPIAYNRVAAYMLYAMANTNAWPAAVTQILDVKLNGAAAANTLRAMAKEFLDMDDNSGAFMMIEQVNDDFSFRSRFWRQWQRQSQSG